MSRVVKGVGRAIGSVVKGAANVVKTVAKSPIGRLAAGAALMYFGVPAASGLFGGGAAAASGASGLAGAMTNISTAWSGLTGAASSAIAGNVGQAGSQLASGFTGGGIAGPAGEPGGASTLSSVARAAAGDVGSPLTSLGPQSPTTYGLTGAPSAIPGVDAVGGSGLKVGGMSAGSWSAPQTSGGLISRAMQSSLTPYALQLAGGIYTDYAKAKTLEATQQRQDRLEADARARYSTNSGTALWPGPAPRG